MLVDRALAASAVAIEIHNKPDFRVSPLKQASKMTVNAGRAVSRTNRLEHIRPLAAQPREAGLRQEMQ